MKTKVVILFLTICLVACIALFTYLNRKDSIYKQQDEFAFLKYVIDTLNSFPEDKNQTKRCIRVITLFQIINQMVSGEEAYKIDFKEDLSYYVIENDQKRDVKDTDMEETIQIELSTVNSLLNKLAAAPIYFLLFTKTNLINNLTAIYIAYLVGISYIKVGLQVNNLYLNEENDTIFMTGSTISQLFKISKRFEPLTEKEIETLKEQSKYTKDKTLEDFFFGIIELSTGLYKQLKLDKQIDQLKNDTREHMRITNLFKIFLIILTFNGGRF